jgi:hypothetical protein
MCFSAQASFASGATLLVIGAMTVRLVSTRAELPYALIPILFGLQQLLEGALWLTFPDRAPALNTWLTHAYSLFSHVLWPIYVPLAALALEPVQWRRRVLTGIAGAGALVGLYLLAMMIRLPITARVAGQHIVYDSPHFYVLTTMALYLIGTCASLMFSSHSRIVMFGLAAFGSAIAAYAFYATWFISVWCFFAALLSAIVVWHFCSSRAARLVACPSPEGPTSHASAQNVGNDKASRRHGPVGRQHPQGQRLAVERGQQAQFRHLIHRRDNEQCQRRHWNCNRPVTDHSADRECDRIHVDEPRRGGGEQ